jgi:transposase
MSKRTRRKHSSQQKAALLKKHHVEKVPVSDVCDQAEVQPSLFYNWQRQLFENAATVLEAGRKGTSSHDRVLQARVTVKGRPFGSCTGRRSGSGARRLRSCGDRLG